jgi:formiminotetrahydrofolate cyclodeaminase
MGAMTGGSAAALSAKMSAGLLSVAKEQLSVSKSIEKNLRKDRNNKGIWAP